VTGDETVEYHHTGRGEIQHGPVEAPYMASVSILHARAEEAVEIFDASAFRKASTLLRDRPSKP
jgi:hypothetical protein